MGFDFLKLIGEQTQKAETEKVQLDGSFYYLDDDYSYMGGVYCIIYSIKPMQFNIGIAYSVKDDVV